jgi:quinoprotein glucose dehydrogenase
VDLNSGDFRWRVVLGEFEELRRRGVPKTGTPNIGGSLVTAGGIVFIAATSDRRFRAFDKDTGRELWSAALPASGFAAPMTYAAPKSGRQMVVIAAGGGNKYDSAYSGQLVAFALPRTASPATPGAPAPAAPPAAPPAPSDPARGSRRTR